MRMEVGDGGAVRQCVSDNVNNAVDACIILTHTGHSLTGHKCGRLLVVHPTWRSMLAKAKFQGSK
jgi:hypothetical protein